MKNSLHCNPIILLHFHDRFFAAISLLVQISELVTICAGAGIVFRFYLINTFTIFS